MNKQLYEFSYSLRKERRRKVFFIIIYFLSIFILINSIIKFLIFPVRQVSESMTPDICKNSFVMITPMQKKAGRGDVVLLKEQSDSNLKFTSKLINVVTSFFTAQQIFYTENDSVPGTKSELRRIIGIPGDTIYMRDYVLYIKPEGEKHFLTEFELCDKTYNVTFYVPPAEWDTSIGVKGSFDEITLSKNEYFVLGDNRKSSSDSRLWGPVTESQIKGKALFCYYPFNNFRLF